MVHADRLRTAALTACIVIAASGRAEPALAQFGGIDEASAGWRAHQSRDGLTLERRTVAGSRYYEYRVVVDLPVDPVLVADDVWKTLWEGDMYDLKRRQVLSASTDEMVLYDQIRVPIVHDRDYVIRVRRIRDPARHRTQIRCETVDGVGPPPAPGHVRMQHIRAGWVVEPGPGGGTRLTNYAYSEPGGRVAAFLVHDGQASHSLADMDRMVRRLKRLAAAH